MVGVVGAAVTGRKDLPRTFHFVGSQVGRVVGLLQGARARADQFAAQNELRQLQNELRSGLRELDQVRMELAVAASSQGIVGRNLGAMTPSANRDFKAPISNATAGLVDASPSVSTSGPQGLMGKSAGAPPLSKSNTSDSSAESFSFDLPTSNEPIPLASLAAHSEMAALEDEWEKQGIGYQTRAEQIFKEQAKSIGGPASGSQVLEALIKQNLLWDQYERVVSEQESQVQGRIDARKSDLESKSGKKNM